MNIRMLLKKASELKQNSILGFTIIITLEIGIYGTIGYIICFLLGEMGILHKMSKGMAWEFLVWILAVGIGKSIIEWNSRRNRK